MYSKTTVIAKAFLSAFLVIFFLTSYGQENFKPGYIIPLQGDTVHGFIDYRNWNKNPEQISFRETPDGKISTFYPYSIKAFKVLDETYEGAVVQVENSPTETSELSYDKNLSLEFDSAFLQVVVKGEKSLYHYRTSRGKDQFYIRHDSVFDLLVYKRYLKDVGGESVIAENNTFIGQLTIYLYGCKDIRQALNGVKYQKNSLENLFLHYYSCTNTSVVFHKETEKTRLEFGILAGVTYTKLKLEGELTFTEDAAFDPSVNFTGGVFLNVVLPRNLRKWSVNNEIIYQAYNMESQFEIYENENKHSNISATLEYVYVKMNNMVRFRFPAGKCFIFANVGITNGVACYEKNYIKKETTFYDQHTVTEGKTLNETRKWEFGMMAGLGAQYKKFSLEFRFERGNGMSAFANLNSKTYRYTGFLGYRF